MTEFIEIIEKDANIQNEISQTIDKYNKESFSTRSQIGQNALYQSKVQTSNKHYGRNNIRYGHGNRTKR